MTKLLFRDKEIEAIYYTLLRKQMELKDNEQIVCGKAAEELGNKFGRAVEEG